MRVQLGDWLVLLLLAAWIVLYFLPVTIGQGVWFTTDIIRLFHPFAVELAHALNEGRLPMWTPGILSGFPLLAEGQVGALYPVNWALLRLLPEHIALSYGILLHLVWVAWGMYLFVRSSGAGIPGSTLAALVASWSGFVFGHLSHPSVIATMSWLPWMLLFQRRWSHSRGMVWLVLTTFASSLQFLTGSIQIAFLNSIAFVFFGFVSEIQDRNKRARIQQRLYAIIVGTVLPLVLGAGIAAIQLMPTAELVEYSVRHETTAEFATSYSLAPESLVQFIYAFSQGEPAETNGEYWAYIGLEALSMAVMALLLRRDSTTYAIAAFVIVASLLALGGYTPFYPSLLGLPIFGMFRAPARFMYLAIFGGAILAARGLDALAKRMQAAKASGLVIALGGTVVLVIVGVVKTQPADVWLPAWQWIPLCLAFALGALMLLGRAGRLPGPSFATLVVGLALVDFGLFAPPFLATIDALTPSSYVAGAPRSLDAFGDPSALSRVYTDLTVFPSVPALRGSLFPNTSLVYGQASAQGYTSLSLSGQDAFSFDPSPAMLNLMGVKYLAIPLEPRPTTKRSTPSESLGLDIIDNEVIVPPTAVTAVSVAGYTESANELPESKVIAQLRVRLADTGVIEFPIRAGVETDAWDRDRKTIASPVSLASSRIAHDFPGFWRSFGRQFQGHTFDARFDLPLAAQVMGIEVRIVEAQATLGIENVHFEGPGARIYSLAELAARNEFLLRYMSDTVAIWENLNVLPRAFLVHSAQPSSDARALAMLKDPDFDPGKAVILADTLNRLDSTHPADGTARITEYGANRVQIQVQAQQPGYLVLTDSWYPGWRATIDGQPVPIERADLVYRAVLVRAGPHIVVFEYRPESFTLVP